MFHEMIIARFLLPQHFNSFCDRMTPYLRVTGLPAPTTMLYHTCAHLRLITLEIKRTSIDFSHQVAEKALEAHGCKSWAINL